MSKLDFFEGSEYVRKRVQVRGLQQGEGEETESSAEPCWVYIFIEPHLLDKREWDFEEFRNDKMKHWTRGDWRFEQG